MAALAHWVNENPNDSLAPAVTDILESGKTAEINSVLKNLARRSYTPAFMGSFTDGIARGISAIFSPGKLKYAASGFLIGGIISFGAINFGGVNQPAVVNQSAHASSVELQIASAAPQVESIPDYDAAAEPVIDEAASHLNHVVLSFTTPSETPLPEEPVISEVEDFEIETLSTSSEFASSLEELEPVAFEIDPISAEILLAEARSIEEAKEFIAPIAVEPSLPEVVQKEIKLASIELPNEVIVQEDIEDFNDVEETETNEFFDSETEDAFEKIIEPELEETIIESKLLPSPFSAADAGSTFADRLENGSIAPEMVVISSGSFEMGAPLWDRARDQSERPQRNVDVSQACLLYTSPSPRDS